MSQFPDATQTSRIIHLELADLERQVFRSDNQIELSDDRTMLRYPIGNAFARLLCEALARMGVAATWAAVADSCTESWVRFPDFDPIGPPCGTGKKTSLTTWSSGAIDGDTMKLIDDIENMSAFELLEQRSKSMCWISPISLKSWGSDPIVVDAHTQIIKEIDAELRIRLAAAKEESWVI